MAFLLVFARRAALIKSVLTNGTDIDTGTDVAIRHIRTGAPSSRRQSRSTAQPQRSSQVEETYSDVYMPIIAAALYRNNTVTEDVYRKLSAFWNIDALHNNATFNDLVSMLARQFVLHTFRQLFALTETTHFNREQLEIQFNELVAGTDEYVHYPIQDVFIGLIGPLAPATLANLRTLLRRAPIQDLTTDLGAISLSERGMSCIFT